MGNTMSAAAMNDLVATICEANGWEEQEARNFLSCITAATPEALIRAVTAAVEIARETETRAAMIGLMKQLGRIVEAQVKDGDLALRLNPDLKAHEIVGADGRKRLEIDFRPLVSAAELTNVLHGEK